MCDEYDDERMVMFWRRLETLEHRDARSDDAEDIEMPPLSVEPSIQETAKPKPRPILR